jgi:hypothetical protein
LDVAEHHGRKKVYSESMKYLWKWVDYILDQKRIVRLNYTQLQYLNIFIVTLI